MANNSRKRKIAQEIVSVECDKVLNPEDKMDKIIGIIVKYKLGLIDLMEIDDLVMNMLEKVDSV